jgi:hypothetical protein
MKKLIEIQAALKAPKNQYNSFGKYNYRSQEDILEALKPLLKQHECTLTISDSIKTEGPFTFVEAKATIQNGTESVSVTAQAGIADRKGMDLAQSFGSSSSYARKYALNGLFLIDDTKDADSTNTHGKEESKPESGLELLRKEVTALLFKVKEEQRPSLLVKINNAKTEKELQDYKTKLQGL